MKLLRITSLIGVIFALMVSCTEDDPTDTTYQTKDLSGTWSGDLEVLFIGGIMDGVDSVMNITFTFQDDGTFIAMEPSPDYTSISGKLTVNTTGEISGTVTAIHVTPSGNEWTYMQWDGCAFASKDEIAVNMTWTWENEGDPNGGSYIINGTLNR